MQPVERNASHLKYVNLLFLIVLVLQASNYLFLWMPQYVRLVLNEALFVFLPAYLYLRFTHQPIRQRVRWRWPGASTALISLLVGAGLYPFSAALAVILQTWLGYINFQTPADAIPTTVPGALLAVLAYAAMAPLCEEFLFRGVIQPEYERRGPLWGVLFVGLLFIIFHLALLQGLSIILLALTLGFINYRTRSLPASILAHFGANFLAALVITQEVFNLDINPYLFSLPGILVGLFISSAGLLSLSRLGRPAPGTVQMQLAPAPETPAARLSLSAGWPLVLAAIIYLVITGMEVYQSRTPVQVDPLAVGPVHVDELPVWQYEITNIEDTRVGEGQCQLSMEGEQAEIICSSSVIAYEVTIERSTWMSVGGSRVDLARWQPDSGQLVSGQTGLDLLDSDFQLEVNWTVGEEGMQIHQRGTDEPGSSTFVPYSETPVGENTSLLLVPDYTWPWQLAGIQREAGDLGQVVRFNPFIWRDATQDMGHLWESRTVKVVGLEEVTTPAGSFMAWKVLFGDNQIAWYHPGENLTVLKFFNGAETWSLK